MYVCTYMSAKCAVNWKDSYTPWVHVHKKRTFKVHQHIYLESVTLTMTVIPILEQISMDTLPVHVQAKRALERYFCQMYVFGIV